MKSFGFENCIRSAVWMFLACLFLSFFPHASSCRDTELNFSNPPTEARPMSRLWFPDAGAGASEEGLVLVSKQISDMAEDGFGGVEIQFLADNSDFSNAEARTVGFGSKNWRNLLKEVLRTANAIPGGFQVDLTITAHWPAIVNNIDPNDEASQQQLTYAFQKITAADMSKGTVDLPLPHQRTEDYSSNDALVADFLFVDRYQAASVLKVVDFKNGRPVFEFASIIDASPQTVKRTVSDAEIAAGAACKTENGVKYAGYAAGIPDFDTAWLRGLSYSKILAQWGPEPADRNMKGKIDEGGNRKRMADWQYLYRTDLSNIPELKNYNPSPGDELKAGDYVLFGIYTQGIGELMSGGSSVTEYNRSYASDLYNVAGTRAIEDFWNKNILDDELLSLLKENADQNTSNALFEDSYEYYKTGPIWTAGALNAVTADHQYDASKYAAVYALTSAERRGGMPEAAEAAGGPGMEGPPGMEGTPGAQGAPGMGGPPGMQGAPTGQGGQGGMGAPGRPATSSASPGFKSDAFMDRIMEDLTVTLGRLYRAAHVDGIRDFAGRFGYVYRAQIQAGSTGVSGAEAGAGVQEVDNQPGDPARNLLGAANLNGTKILSAESLTSEARDYTNTWKPLVTGLNILMGSGVNRNIYHGVPFVRSFNGYSNEWPGWTFEFGTTGFGAFDRRQAFGEYLYQFNNYVARTQAVLQTGVAQVDLAILQGTEGRYSMPPSEKELQVLLDSGYSYNFIDEAMMELPSARVNRGVLAANGPAYKALVVLNATKMTVDGVDRLISYAEAGLPIILYSSDVTKVFGTNKPGYTDEIVTKRFAGLKKMKKVSSVTNEAEFLSALSSRNIEPYANYAIPGVVTNTRMSSGNYYYTLYTEGTSLQTRATAGDNGIRVVNTTNLKPGDQLILDISDRRELVTVAAVNASASSGPNVMLACPLTQDHAGAPAPSGGFPSKETGALVSNITNRTVSLSGTGTPYLLDPWTGKEIPVGLYKAGEGRVSFDVSIPAKEILMYKIRAEGGKQEIHAVSSTGGNVLYNAGNDLVHRTTQPGNFDVELSSGDKKSFRIDTVPTAVSLADGWSLELESWGPDPVANLINPSLSKKTTVRFSDIELGNWTDLPATEEQLSELGVEDMGGVVGIGAYTKAFTLPSDWDASVGAGLQLAHGEDIVVGITVNGRKLDPINQLTDNIDLSGHLKTGNNSIRIEIATQMANRAPGKEAEVFGLTGVQLLPYVETKFSRNQ